jgi:choline dehydrogenase
MVDSLDFDIVVVGGGAAGCAFVARLCRITDLRVCLVEAGPDYGPAKDRWPAELLDPRRFPTSHDWGLNEERGERELPEPRAKVIGGCSTHNQCAAVWGLPGDYERWAELTGDSGWSYSALRPLIDDIEDASGGDAAFRGRGGLLPTRVPDDEELASWQCSFLDAAGERGFARLTDLSAPEPAEGARPFQANVHDGKRWNAAFAFLDGVRQRRTLRVVSDCLADRLVFRESRAEAVVCFAGGHPFELRARQFVLASGTYGSPAILLRSGIGPAGELERLAIEPVADVPPVGANLHDHAGVPVRFAPTAAAARELEEDLGTGRFHQSQVALRAAGHGLHVLPYQAALEDRDWSFHLIAFAMAPASRGIVSLRSIDPTVSPRIDFGFVSDERSRDLTTLREGVSLIRGLADAPALARRAHLLRDGAGEIEADLDGYIGANVSGYGHAVGTCRMGIVGDADTVTDAAGLVHGTANVRVADASLMPIIPSANTSLSSMLIGWRLAEAVAAAAG